MPKILTEQKKEAIRLRLEDRKSLEAISKELNVSQSTCSNWLRDMPLTDEEKHQRYVLAGIASKQNLEAGNRKNKCKITNSRSALFNLSEEREYTSNQKGKIAESAVMLRLSILQADIYKSVFDGEKLDFVIQMPNQNNLIKVQVRWACKNKQALGLKLRCSNGRNSSRRYTEDEFDFIVAYDLFADKCYVYSKNELLHIKSLVTCSIEFEEKWNKLLI